MTMDAIAHALLLALVAAEDGDTPTAQAHVAEAGRLAQRAARRHRQIIEIAALVVAGQPARAAGLALEHTAAFPEDVELLVCVADATRPGAR